MIIFREKVHEDFGHRTTFPLLPRTRRFKARFGTVGINMAATKTLAVRKTASEELKECL